MAEPSAAPQTELRDHWTIHVYVDPIYGDDNKAWSGDLTQTTGGYNPVQHAPLPPPAPPTRGRPLQVHPTNTTLVPGHLQHVPYSFKTVTRALQWVEHLRATTSNLALPWTNLDPDNDPETTGDEQTAEYVVIHCLPGLYGPLLENPLDDESGLIFNGESFPLHVPPRVSIQGTSALDTIFDARLTETSVFALGYLPPLPQDEIRYEFTFIDSLTIRGARGTLHPELPNWGPLSARDGAGVLIFGLRRVKATISNCFLVNNVVGVGVLHEYPDAEEEVHEARVINNSCYAAR